MIFSANLVDEGLVFSLSNRVGVSFTQSTIDTVFEKARQTDLQTGATYLKCGICGNPIVVNSDNKEEWVSFSGKLHATRPHIDHHNPDWNVRKKRVERSPNYINGEVAKKNNLLNDQYNAPSLRLAHRTCNICKPPS